MGETPRVCRGSPLTKSSEHPGGMQQQEVVLSPMHKFSSSQAQDNPWMSPLRTSSLSLGTGSLSRLSHFKAAQFCCLPVQRERPMQRDANSFSDILLGPAAP